MDERTSKCPVCEHPLSPTKYASRFFCAGCDEGFYTGVLVKKQVWRRIVGCGVDGPLGVTVKMVPMDEPR